MTAADLSLTARIVDRIDKIPAEDPTCFPVSPGIAPDVATLLSWIADHMPPRPAVTSRSKAPPSTIMQAGAVVSAGLG